MRKELIAVDLGGTQIRTGRFDHKLNLLQREHTLTLANEGLQPTITRLKAYIEKVMPDNRSKIMGIGVSSPGPLNPKSGVIIAPPNLPGWHEVPLADIFRDEFGLPVFVGNDANVAALAEACEGAAQGQRNVVYITISTGIGSGVICDGRLLLGRDGLAAELGHVPILVENGRVSSVELEAAGPAIARRARQAIANGSDSVISDMVDGDHAGVDAEIVGKAAAAGDELAIEILAYTGKIVGLAIVTALHLFNPEIVVLGGGVTKTGAFLFDPVRQSIDKHVLDSAYTEKLRIENAALGDDVALVGAAALVATDGGNMDISVLDDLF